MSEQGAVNTAPISPRRVVIGLAQDGRSSAIFDDRPDHVVPSAYPGIASNMLWKDSPAADIASREDQAVVWKEVPVPVDGSRFYMVTIGPGVEASSHATPTLEYHYVVSGAITITLEDADVDVAAGDTIVMRGVPHGWRNSGSEPFVSVATMVGMHKAFAGARH